MMRMLYPSMFTGFSCLAGKCPLTCCELWSVDIDEQAMNRYRLLPLKERTVVLDHLVKEGDAYSFEVTKGGRCWFLDADGLCRMQRQYGEEMLCETCRHFPRLSWNSGDYLQFSMDLACPLASEMAYSRPFAILEEQVGEEPSLDLRDAAGLDALLHRREKLIASLQDGEVVRKIVLDSQGDHVLARVVALCTKASKVGFLTPSRIRHLRQLSFAYWEKHASTLVPWFSTFGSLLLFRYGPMASYGMLWARIVRFVRRSMRLTYLLLLHQERDGDELDVEAMVAASVLFSRRIEHVERNLHTLIMV